MRQDSDAIAKIDNAITQINHLLDESGTPAEGPGSRNQLLKIMYFLNQMKQNLIDKNTSQADSNYGLGRLVADSWSDDSILGNAILDAEQAYVKAIKSLRNKK